MLAKCVSKGQLLSSLPPERQVRFLLKMRNQCYTSGGFYIEESGEVWELSDILEALNKLPHVKNKQERKADNKLS